MRIAVLGPLEVLTGDSVPVSVPGTTERLLLAVLAAGAPGAVATEELLAVLPAGTGEAALRDHLGRLRRALEPGLPERSSGQYVLRRGAGYVLAVGRSDIDALRFDGLVQRGRALAAGDPAEAVRLLTAALALWRGEPYGDWPDASFAQAERDRLAGVHADALTALEDARQRPRERRAARAVLIPPVARYRLPQPLPGEPRASGAPAPGAAAATESGSPVRWEAAPGSIRPARPGAAARPRRAVLVGGLVAALVAAGLAVRSQREVADAPSAAGLSDAERAATIVARQDPLDISLLLAVAAVRTENSPGARSRLLAVLARLGRAKRVVPFVGIPQDPVLSGGRVLTFRNDRTVLSWTVDSAPPARVLMGIPGEWGAWLVTAPSPVEPVVMTAGENLGGAWLSSVSAVDGTYREIAAADQLGGRPVEGAVTLDGRRVRLLLEAPGDAIRWRMVEVDTRDGAVRDTGVDGAMPAVADALAADFSDDAGALVVWDVTRSAGATLVDVRTGRQTAIPESSRTAASTGFVALPSGAVQLWDDGLLTRVDERGNAVQELDAHDGQVRDVVLSPDGTWAVTAGDGSEVVRWDVDPGTGTWFRPERLTGHAGGVVGVEVDATGRTLLTVSLDNRVIAWDMRDRGGVRQDRARRLPSMDPAEQLAEACDVVGRDLTVAEWSTYLPDDEYRPTCTDLP
jgi:hypothetical protein